MPRTSLHLLLFSAIVSACVSIPAEATAVSTVPPATATIAPTAALPIAHVGGSVPCYADASTDAPVLTTMEIADPLEIHGEARGDHYWAVQPPDIDGFCWILSDYVTVVGSTEQLPHLVPTLVPVPAAPAEFTGVVECRNDTPNRDSEGIFAHLTWAPTERATGYRLYLDGEFVVELPAGESSYTALIQVRRQPLMTGAVTFEIEALSYTGASERTTLELVYRCVFENYLY